MFQPTPFVPHRLIRGGHLQTLLAWMSRRGDTAIDSASTETIPVDVSDGDRIALHLNLPQGDATGEGQSGADAQATASPGSVLLIHGLTGCHAAHYMIRLADQFLRAGYRTFRMDLRGFGVTRKETRNVSHAGRSDDVAAAIAAIHRRFPGQRVTAIGISLGGAQLLRAIGRIDAGLDPRPAWRDELVATAAVCPPIDLAACSTNMRRRSRRVYNRFFIGNLIKRLPPAVADGAEFRRRAAMGRPRTLWELDDQFTAPLGGFDSAIDYYQRTSCGDLLPHLQTPTLILASADDPIVPAECFTKIASRLTPSTTLWVSDQGGHVGFVGPGRRCWMDQVLVQWSTAAARQSTRQGPPAVLERTCTLP